MCSDISSNGVGGPQFIGQLSETEIGQFIKGTLLVVRAGAGLSRILPKVWCAFTSCSMCCALVCVLIFKIASWTPAKHGKITENTEKTRKPWKTTENTENTESPQIKEAFVRFFNVVPCFFSFFPYFQNYVRFSNFQDFQKFLKFLPCLVRNSLAKIAKKMSTFFNG